MFRFENYGKKMIKYRTVILLCFCALMTTSCGQDLGGADEPANQAVPERNENTFGPIEVVPGVSVGGIEIGMSLDELKAILGDPDTEFGFQRLITLRFNAAKLEVLLTSSEPSVASADARVRGVTTLGNTVLSGDLIRGVERTVLEAQFGAATMESRGILYFVEDGLSVEMDADNRAIRYSVWPAYFLEKEIPPMVAAKTQMGEPRIEDESVELPRFEYEGDVYTVVDMHLHVGKKETQKPTGLEFLLSQLPAMSLMTFPAVSGLVVHPYGEHVGIKEHLRAAGVAYGVLLATYTQHTIGVTENQLVESQLADPRNVNPDGSQWAWGMASINLDDFDSPEVMERRLEILESYFEKRPDLFVGIKLAHAHQAVGFDDPLYLGVYDVAAKYGVPVLLHTGFSPFPNSMTDPHYYDPATLEAVITAYNGQNGKGYVDFVLAHAGQGDARAIESSLQLAQTRDNVWLEISAINRPLLIDENGQPVESTEPMHTYVLGEIKNRGIVGKTMFATDGPQYFGKVQSYLKLMVSTMKSVGYTPEEIQAVLADNFFNCYLPFGK
ncbi:MAG: hypothetical protein CMH54_08310 [Myxococcales bacterium]|nr:hypothetical protein [Myxococcales bacterium]